MLNNFFNKLICLVSSPISLGQNIQGPVKEFYQNNFNVKLVERIISVVKALNGSQEIRLQIPNFASYDLCDLETSHFSFLHLYPSSVK